MRGSIREFHIDRGCFRAQMQPDRHAAGQRVHRARDHVLAAVLLHVIESARPVDFAVYAIADG